MKLSDRVRMHLRAAWADATARANVEQADIDFAHGRIEFDQWREIIRANAARGIKP